MKKFAILTMLLCFGYFSIAQNADEENIKKVIQSEVDAYVKRDINAFKANWMQDPASTTTFVSHYQFINTKGWDSISAAAERNFKQNPKPIADQYKAENFRIRVNGEMAVVNYDLVVTPATDQSSIFPYIGVNHFSNMETLVKDNGEWKVTSRIVMEPESYGGNMSHLAEGDINNAGYYLIAANRVKDAIEVFKLNVKLFPDSWNTYDSLGEAYALAGDKKQAIEFYEKSMKLNPKSESGPPALAKLKQKQ